MDNSVPASDLVEKSTKPELESNLCAEDDKCEEDYVRPGPTERIKKRISIIEKRIVRDQEQLIKLNKWLSDSVLMQFIEENKDTLDELF